MGVLCNEQQFFVPFLARFLASSRVLPSAREICFPASTIAQNEHDVTSF